MQRVEELLAKPASLRVELHNSVRERVEYGVLVDCYPSRRFWNGTLVSNKIRFPAKPPERLSRKCVGQAMNGLCASVAVSANAAGGKQLDLIVQNDGATDRMLPLSQSGQGFAAAVWLEVQRARKTSSIAVPLTIHNPTRHVRNTWLPMLSKTRYTISVPFQSLRLSSSDEFSLRFEISVRRDNSSKGDSADCFPGCLAPPPRAGAGERDTPDRGQLCWTGKLVSNMTKSLLPAGPSDAQ
jgi:hypothetical protein